MILVNEAFSRPVGRAWVVAGVERASDEFAAVVVGLQIAGTTWRASVVHRLSACGEGILAPLDMVALWREVRDLDLAYGAKRWASRSLESDLLAARTGVRVWLPPLAVDLDALSAAGALDAPSLSPVERAATASALGQRLPTPGAALQPRRHQVIY